MSLKDFQIQQKLGMLFLLILGEGAYSTVYKVKRITDGREYAIKKVIQNVNSRFDLEN
jgi:NIMA (never in mitosis gene a)-related kinase